MMYIYVLVGIIIQSPPHKWEGQHVRNYTTFLLHYFRLVLVHHA